MTDRCDTCGRFSSDLSSVTVCISYDWGPMMQELCSDCRDGGRDAGLKFRMGGTPDD